MRTMQIIFAETKGSVSNRICETEMLFTRRKPQVMSLDKKKYWRKGEELWPLRVQFEISNPHEEVQHKSEMQIRKEIIMDFVCLQSTEACCTQQIVCFPDGNRFEKSLIQNDGT